MQYSYWCNICLSSFFLSEMTMGRGGVTLIKIYCKLENSRNNYNIELHREKTIICMVGLISKVPSNDNTPPIRLFLEKKTVIVYKHVIVKSNYPNLSSFSVSTPLQFRWPSVNVSFSSLGAPCDVSLSFGAAIFLIFWMCKTPGPSTCKN